MYPSLLTGRKSYEQGSTELEELLSTYQSMYNSLNVPLYIGGESIHTSKK